MQSKDRLSTGNDALNWILGGGLAYKSITQFYGEPGTGKSTLVLISLITCLQSGKGVIFFDTEGFSVERFRQIAGNAVEQLAESLYIYEPHGFDQQGVMITKSELIIKKRKIGLIIMDSATALYRTELGLTKEAQRRLANQMIYLLGLSRRYKLPVLITNQVYIDPEKNELRPLGGAFLQHLSKVIVRLDKLDGFRRAILVKHHLVPKGISFDFELTEYGINRI